MLPDTIRNIIAVGAGSFIGGIARYLVSLVMKGISKGFLSRNASESTSWGLFLTVGLCGGFTTFSTFANESIQMLQGGNIIGFASYIAASIILGLALVVLGYNIVS